MSTLVAGDVVYTGDPAPQRIRAVDKLPDGSFTLWGSFALFVWGNYQVEATGVFAPSATLTRVTLP